MTGLSPLERRALIALISLIRDREPDRGEWPITYVPLSALYERCYRLDPAKSYELQRRNQRQAMRRALGRLHRAGIIEALALGWVDVRDSEFLRWQGGGSRRSYAVRDDGGLSARYGEETPRWRLAGLSDDGIALAEALDRESDGA